MSEICPVCSSPLVVKKQKRICKTCVALKSRAARLKKWFRITLDEYAKILALQGGVCSICKKTQKSGKPLAVDHDHKSGLVRGLLCSMCNRTIALFRDDLQKVQNAADYLRSPPATQALGAPRFGLRGRVSNKAATVRRLNPELNQ